MRVAQAMGNPSCGTQKKEERKTTNSVSWPYKLLHRSWSSSLSSLSHNISSRIPHSDCHSSTEKRKEKRCGRLQTTVIIMTESHPTIVSYYAETVPWGCCCGWFPNSIICFIKKPFSSMNCSSSNPMNKYIRLGFGYKICEICLTPAIIMKFG